jgi:hypothetical protein
VWADVSADVCVSELCARGEAANGRDDAQWEWDPGYRAGAPGRPDHSEQGIKKKRALSPVNKVVVEGGCPDASTVELRRIEAAEVDAMWSFVQSKAPQRWL